MDNNLEESLLFSHKDYLCTVMYRIAHLCEIKQNTILKEYGVVHQQAQVLAFIYARQYGEVFQKDIENAMFLKSSTVTKTLNTLEKNGFIVRVPCEKDKRAKKLQCTKKAIELHEVFLGSVIQVGEKITLGFSESEKEALNSLLVKVYRNMGE